MPVPSCGARVARRGKPSARLRRVAPVSGGYVGALEIEIQVLASASLKDKRAVLQHLLETVRQRYRAAAAEIAGQELWQRSTLGFAVVGSSPRHLEEVLDAIERFVWSHAELVVLATNTKWLNLAD